MLSNLDLLNRDLVLLYPRINVKSIDFAKTIKIFKIRRYFQNTPLYKLWETFKDFYKT